MPFKDDALRDVSQLEVYDVVLRHPYMWKFHAMYESRPHSAIVTLDIKLYMIPKVAPPIAISLISSKNCKKVISKIENQTIKLREYLHPRIEEFDEGISMASFVHLCQSFWSTFTEVMPGLHYSTHFAYCILQCCDNGIIFLVFPI